jgi:hypothetical protein
VELDGKAGTLVLAVATDPAGPLLLEADLWHVENRPARPPGSG